MTLDCSICRVARACECNPDRDTSSECRTVAFEFHARAVGAGTETDDLIRNKERGTPPADK